MGNYKARHTRVNGVVIWLQDILKVSVPKPTKSHQHLHEIAINKVMKKFLESETNCVLKKNARLNCDKVQDKFAQFKIWAKQNKEEVQRLLNS